MILFVAFVRHLSFCAFCKVRKKGQGTETLVNQTLVHNTDDNTQSQSVTHTANHSPAS